MNIRFVKILMIAAVGVVFPGCSGRNADVEAAEARAKTAEIEAANARVKAVEAENARLKLEMENASLRQQSNQTKMTPTYSDKVTTQTNQPVPDPKLERLVETYMTVFKQMEKSASDMTAISEAGMIPDIFPTDERRRASQARSKEGERLTNEWAAAEENIERPWSEIWSLDPAGNHVKRGVSAKSSKIYLEGNRKSTSYCELSYTP